MNRSGPGHSDTEAGRPTGKSPDEGQERDVITDELARNRDEWTRRADLLSSIAQACRQIDSWESPTGQLLDDRLIFCAASIDGLSEKAAKVAEAYDLHLQVVSVGGRIQI